MHYMCWFIFVVSTYFKLPLGREVWNIVDIVTAVFLIYLYLKEMYEIRKR